MLLNSVEAGCSQQLQNYLHLQISDSHGSKRYLARELGNPRITSAAERSPCLPLWTFSKGPRSPDVGRHGHQESWCGLDAVSRATSLRFASPGRLRGLSRFCHAQRVGPRSEERRAGEE